VKSDRSIPGPSTWKSSGRRALLAGAAGVLLVATASTPAHADYYSGGLSTAVYSVSYSVNATWSAPMDASLSAWTATPTPVVLSKSSGSDNTVTVASFSDTWYGYYDPCFWSDCFEMSLNSRTINRDASNWYNFVKSTFVHELGHGLSLADNPTESTAASIMRHTRNRNTMHVPQAYDIQEVNSYY
jgi:hypothetical protein